MKKVIVVTTTCDDRLILQQIARTLVEDKIAACCQISGSIESIYRWQGKVESATEFACWIKTTESRANDVIEVVKKLHSYDEPEIVATEIVAGSSGYLNWVRDNVEQPPESDQQHGT